MRTGAIWRPLLAAIAVAAWVAALGSSASATQTHLFEENFGSANKPTFQFEGPSSATVIQSSHGLLIVDRKVEGGYIGRWKANGEPDPFPALGTNVIDAAKGPGGKPCAEEPASCDASPINGFKGLATQQAQLQVAVDESSGPTAGNIYVNEYETGTVDVFAADGTYLNRITRCGSTKIANPAGVAVDPDGNLYVSDPSNNAVHKFIPTSNAPSNTDCSLGNDIKAIERSDAIAMGAGPSAGYLFIVRHTGSIPAFSGGVFKVKLSTGQVQYAVLDNLVSSQGNQPDVTAITVDPGTGHLFVAQREGEITEFDVSGSSAATEVSTFSRYNTALAADGVSGKIYLGFPGKLEVYGPAVVTQPAVETVTPAENITPSKATLKGTVDPDGQGLTDCTFEYGLTGAPYEHTVPCSQTLAEIGSGQGPVPVDVRVTGLPANLTTIHYRLSASNANGVPVVGADGTFSTRRIADSEEATEVGGSEAVLNGYVYPDGASVDKCTFQYLPRDEFSTEVQKVTLGGATGGSFTLLFEGDETAAIPFDAEASQVSDALQALPGIDGLSVSGAAGGSYTVTFFGAESDVAELGADGSNLVPGSATVGVETVTEGNGWNAATEVPCAESAAEIGEGEGQVSVHAPLEGLASGTTYRFRLIAGNTLDGVRNGQRLEFTTLEPVLTGRADAITGSSATLNGTVAPYGATVEECFFEWGATAALEGSPVPCVAPSAAEIPADSEEHPVHADLAGLEAGREYHFRLAIKTSAGVERGEVASFETLGPRILGAWASAVTVTEATLNAEINPRGSATTYRLEWGVDGVPFEHVTAESGSIGSDNSPHRVSVPLQGLEADTAYHYRFVATSNCNSSQPSETCAFVGAERVFRTYPAGASQAQSCPNEDLRTGASAQLPNCRAYEMVSPVDKNGAGINVLDGFAVGGFFTRILSRINQASPDGDRFTFSSAQAFAEPLSAPWSSQYLAERGSEGWTTRSLNPPLGKSEIYNQRAQEIPFRAFSEDLCSAWVLQQTDQVLTPGAPTPAPNLYRRRNCEGNGYELLTSVAPPGFTPTNGTREYLPLIRGFTENGSHTFFSANAKLTTDAGSGTNQLYESSEGGGLRLVSVFPNGEAAPEAFLGDTGADQDYHGGNVVNAVAANGKRVFWSSGSGVFNGGALLMRVNPLAPAQDEVGECAEPNRACTVWIAGPNSHFWTADSAGSRVIYQTDNTLFEARIEADEGALVSQSHQIAGGLRGVLGASEDAGRVYLISTEDLAAGATAGQPNIYLYEGDSDAYRFVATVDKEDTTPDGFYAIGSLSSYFRHARVSGDGDQAVFVSRSSLTGYDNIDAASGEPAFEVFMYDAEAESGSGELRCISCNPTGARPRGADLGLPAEGLPHYWSAAEIPGFEYNNHASRVLSEDGSRLFFESHDDLLLTDTNGKTDVYEWQRAAGRQACDAAGAGLYVPAAGGCLSLISSGQSAEDSEFVDASADGRDVFFLTGQSLVADDPGLVDVYDAREGGGFAPRSPAPGCQGEACQGTVTPPSDPTPASSAFEGAGNQKQTKATKKKQKKKKHKQKHRGKKQQSNKRGDHR